MIGRAEARRDSIRAFADWYVGEMARCCPTSTSGGVERSSVTHMVIHTLGRRVVVNQFVHGLVRRTSRRSRRRRQVRNGISSRGRMRRLLRQLRCRAHIIVDNLARRARSASCFERCPCARRLSRRRMSFRIILLMLTRMIGHSLLDNRRRVERLRRARDLSYRRRDP